jgi:hypothetical protein
MTCERHYTPAAVADLQQIAASIEAERRRQHWAEMAQELQKRVAQNRRTLSDPARYDHEHTVTVARLTMLSIFEKWINELSPPVVCDEDQKEER